MSHFSLEPPSSEWESGFEFCPRMSSNHTSESALTRAHVLLFPFYELLFCFANVTLCNKSKIFVMKTLSLCRCPLFRIYMLLFFQVHYEFNNTNSFTYFESFSSLAPISPYLIYLYSVFMDSQSLKKLWDIVPQVNKCKSYVLWIYDSSFSVNQSV